MKTMKRHVTNVIDVFHKTYGVGAYYFDEQVNLAYYWPEQDFMQNSICLGLNRIHAFLQEQAYRPLEENRFYTYVLEHNLISNIVFLTVEGKFAGAIVTQSVFVSKPTQEDIDHLLSQLNQCPHKHSNYVALLLNTPLIPYEKIKPMGEVLAALVKTIYESRKQIMCGGSNKAKISDRSVTAAEYEAIYKNKESKRHDLYTIYIQVKECIQRGDSEALSRLIDEVNPGDMLMDQLIPEDLIRSFKNSCIRIYSICAFAAIETNASYHKIMNLSDEAIQQVETLEHANDIFEHMKKMLFTYARAVNVNHIVTFSKPVRQALDYIQTHFAEKITLAELSKEIGLSASYLSKQMKKETGLSLTDNINKRRIEQSKKLLLGTKLSHFEIANQVGFHYGNHFASIFKKFTKLSPSEYEKTLGLHQGQSAEECHSELFSALKEQLRGTLSMFPTLYDTARLIDPVHHISWILHPQNGESVQGTCYDFWRKKESCKKCISVKAYLENKPCFKTEQNNGETFLVLAIPKTSESQTYVVEILKNITDLL